MQLTALFGTIIALVVMVSASISDWRRREVSDIHWWILGASGIALTAASLDEFRWEYVLMILGMTLTLIGILLDLGSSGKVMVIYHLLLLSSFIVPVAVSHDDPVIIRLCVAPICSAVFLLMFQLGILKGGADAKCLIAMSLMFQTYPEFQILPLIHAPSGMLGLFIAFPMALLYFASIFSFIWFFWMQYRKIRDGDRMEWSTMPYLYMSVDEAERSHVWVRQDVVGGRLQRICTDPDSGVYGRLRAAGAERVLVSPIIPFMIPITLALIFLVTVGNVLFIPFI